MSGVKIRQRAVLKGERGSRKGQEGRPASLYRASWSTVGEIVCNFGTE